MSEHATEKVLIGASVDDVFSVIADVKAYPDWVADITNVEVLETDSSGRPEKVRYSATLAGRTTTYTLQYEWSDAPAVLRWTQADGDLTSVLDGSYELKEVPAGTEVTYNLTIDLRVPVPNFFKRRAEGRIIRSALADLRGRVESA